MGKLEPIRHRQAISREFKSMSGYAGSASNVPWWKEPTKDQWYAYFAAWMGWTLDAFDFTVFLLIMAPIAQEFGVPMIEVTAVFSVTLVMRLGGATAVRLAGRPSGTPGTADDLDLLVFDVQFTRGLLADLHLPVRDPRAAGHRHGRGVASRRGAGDGILAGPLTGTDVGGAARIVGAGLCLVRAGVRLPVRSVRSLA